MLLGLMLAVSAKAGAVTITIKNCTDLQNMQNNLTADYILGNNINCSVTPTWNNGNGFVPIGDSLHPFAGTFNGSNHFIFGLYENNKSSEGLFGVINISDSAKNNIIFNVRLQNIFYDNGNGSTASNLIGGLVGNFNSCAGVCNIINVSVQGTIILRNTNNVNEVGGIVGSNVAYIWSSMSNVNIISLTNQKAAIGGIAGFNFATEIIQSYSLGSIAGVFDNNSSVGGIAGENLNGADVLNVYSLSSITNLLPNNLSDVGGLIGYDSGAGAHDSYAAGLISGFKTEGGDIGSSSGIYNSIYWDKQTTGLNSSAGSYNSFGLSTSDMMNRNSFAGWDFKNTWNIRNGKTYPFLRWQ